MRRLGLGSRRKLRERLRAEGVLLTAEMRAQGGPSCLQTQGHQSKAKKEHIEVDGLFVLLKRFGMESQALSSLAKQRDSFGVAWLSLVLFRRSERSGKVSVNPPSGCFDLSGTCGVSPKKLSLLLDYLPSSVDEMTMDSVIVKGRAEPFFLRFLEGVKVARDGKTEAPLLKSVHFAGELARAERTKFLA
uniref:Uncharacterized protein n=1 Tax=Chromera velia CCMP2878 TaxID=1169474 RepID=A0A0G4HGB4_9ALVE|eukprot:Cvel_27184.t1-p1 / transcript=Cvel_27184.t1 / gene=Cvel_27184 / organism=Chromera_velia_CCMP2878 / gene_product=hypothetical protein / transcript_product=hypothetical protein / location=Cvel_scaffold3353:14429-17560(+) / protein_length=188 / sequence_SO=supercontig / SO=protein_coding / is_pseudo=false